MDVTLKGNEYKTTKLPLFKQFHISRKLAPVIWAGGIYDVIKAFSEMADSDVEYVINSCMECIQRRRGDIAWVPIGNFRAPQFMDIDLQDLYELCATVIKESLGNFFPEMLLRLQQSAVKA
jgi:hypothetical protein